MSSVPVKSTAHCACALPCRHPSEKKGTPPKKFNQRPESSRAPKDDGSEPEKASAPAAKEAKAADKKKALDSK